VFISKVIFFSLFDSNVYIKYLRQECTKPERMVAVATKFCTVTTDTRGLSI